MKLLTLSEISEFKSKLQPGWAVFDNKKLQKEFQFKDVFDVIAFVNKIDFIAEKENHHPDISIRYRSVLVDISTHSINGLSEKDFILAAKIDNL
jgi:4a-hydroxytetrahydrobiopterin dehydratase